MLLLEKLSVQLVIASVLTFEFTNSDKKRWALQNGCVSSLLPQPEWGNAVGCSQSTGCNPLKGPWVHSKGVASFAPPSWMSL